MQTVTIAYWRGTKFPDLPWNNGQELQFTKRQRNNAIDKILSCGYNVMLQRDGDELIIWIDNGKFRQS